MKTKIILIVITVLINLHDVLPQSVYCRPFDLSYAIQGGKQLVETDSTILNAIAAFSPTWIENVLLNVDPLPYDTFLIQLKQITPNLGFALGKPAYVLPNDSATMITLATKYAAYTKCIRIDHFQNLVQYSTESAMLNFLTALHNLGFQHIESNPWKKAPSGNPWIYVESAQIAIDTVTWKAKTARIDSILLNSPNLTILANYENAPGQLKLTSLGAAGSIAAMSVAADSQNVSTVPYRFFPPWSKNYDAYALGTLTWIGQKLDSVDACLTTGLNEMTNDESGITIYPNPSSGEFQVAVGSGSGSEYKIEIYNVYGEKMYSTFINNHSSIINLDIPNGIYFLELKTKDGIAIKKLIIQK
ncbi:MAG: T9SS type A sorting domain-containing protein [Bacteroidetes bacterium]|nr:T9SS type A sorting domain-containing protein [Bacteroidota bacterium]